MNGINKEFTKKVIKKAPHILILDKSISRKVKQEIKSLFLSDNDQISGFYTKGTLIKKDKDFIPVTFMSIEIGSKYQPENIISSCTLHENHIQVSSPLASNESLSLDDDINVYSPRIEKKLFGVKFKAISAKISAIVQSNPYFQTGNTIFSSFDFSKKIFAKTGYNGLLVNLDDPYKSDEIKKLLKIMYPSVYMQTWQEQFAPHLRVLEVEKSLVALVVSMLVLIGAFNLFTSTIMIINSKQKEMAFLKVYGYSKSTILRLFVLIGLFTSTTGILIGNAIGLFLTSNTGKALEWIFYILGMEDLMQSTYSVEGFPVELLISDVMYVNAFAFACAMIACIIPAFSISRKKPIGLIRYD